MKIKPIVITYYPNWTVKEMNSPLKKTNTEFGKNYFRNVKIKEKT